MIAREKMLETLLGLSDRSTTVSRQVLMDRMLAAGMMVCEADCASAVVTVNRALERWCLQRGRTIAACHEVERTGNDFGRTLFRARHPLVLPDLTADPRSMMENAHAGFDVGPAMFIPLYHHGHTNGYLALYRRRESAPFGTDELRLAAFLAAWATLAIENLRLSESLEKLAVTDDLTQVYNFRFLKTALKREIRRAGRYGQQLGLVMIDVDNLKTYNDRNGHLRGSFLLREMAGLFAQSVRSWDLVAKYGGDEFTLILPQTGQEGALVVAERMRQAVESHQFPLTEPGAITVSSGVAVFPDDADDPIGLIHAADRALYHAKRMGRNRVEVAETRAA